MQEVDQQEQKGGEAYDCDGFPRVEGIRDGTRQVSRERNHRDHDHGHDQSEQDDAIPDIEPAAPNEVEDPGPEQRGGQGENEDAESGHAAFGLE